MNPFDLRGPEFLLFYVVLGGVVLGLMVWARRAIESGEPPRLDLGDPYLLARLRGNRGDVVRVAVFSLLHRKLLEWADDRLRATGPAGRVALPLERAILETCREPQAPPAVWNAPAVTAVAGAYERRLEELGLRPGPAGWARRATLAVLAVALLWGVAWVKVVVALSRGRHNLGFLIALAAVFAVAAVALSRGARTALGQRMLGDFRSLFGQLRARAGEPQRALSAGELGLVAAVFGTSIFSRVAFPEGARLERFGPEGRVEREGRTQAHGSSCGTACGSVAASSCSSGSSCGGGGGGGCGGGGGGGGCGGCGS